MEEEKEMNQHKSTNIRTINFLINWVDHELLPNLKKEPIGLVNYGKIKEYSKWMEDDTDSDDTELCKEWLKIQNK